MKNIHMGLVLCGMMSVLFGAGCAGPVEDTPAAEADREVHALCDSGYYTCPSDGAIFEYDTPGCGPIYKPRAQSLCEAHCPVTCKDSGWLGY